MGGDWGELIMGILGLGILTGFIPIVGLLLVLMLIKMLVTGTVGAIHNIPKIRKRTETFEEKIERFETSTEEDEL